MGNSESVMEDLRKKMYLEALEMRGFKPPSRAGVFVCPQCGNEYEPTYKTKAEAWKTDDNEAREQWLSHICSTPCWRVYLGVPEYEHTSEELERVFEEHEKGRKEIESIITTGQKAMKELGLNGTPLEEYREQITETRCYCGYEGLEKLPIQHKDHEYGWKVEGYKELQWLYVMCPKCKYAWNLHKLGVPR